jgi:hypothetical protein
VEQRQALRPAGGHVSQHETVVKADVKMTPW